MFIIAEISPPMFLAESCALSGCVNAYTFPTDRVLAVAHVLTSVYRDKEVDILRDDVYLSESGFLTCGSESQPMKCSNFSSIFARFLVLCQHADTGMVWAVFSCVFSCSSFAAGSCVRLVCRLVGPINAKTSGRIF